MPILTDFPFSREELEAKIGEYRAFTLDSYEKKIGMEYILEDFLDVSWLVFLLGEEKNHKKPKSERRLDYLREVPRRTTAVYEDTPASEESEPG